MRPGLPALPATAQRGVRLGLLALIGAASGISVVMGGYYDLTVWGPIAVAMLALALGLAVTRSGMPRGLPAAAVGALAFIWGWSWLSEAWAEAHDQALITAGRWALYAAGLAALLMLMRRRGDRWLPIGFAAAGICGVAIYVVVRLGWGDGVSLFFGGRLRDPLGYVNGQAGYFLLAFWPCVALAERARNSLLAGLGAGLALVIGALLMLSQSRGVFPGLALSALVLFAIVPGRARRVWVLAVVALGLVAIGRPVLDVYSHHAANVAADPAVVKHAAHRIVLAAVLVALAWAALRTLFGAVTGRAGALRPHLIRLEGALAAVAVVAAIGAGWAALGNPAKRVSDQYNAFVHLKSSSPGDTRFLSGGGNRYDYWRVAWREFKKSPLHGVGAGNYDTYYFAERRTNEDIQQPHSIEMQLLSEEGIIGLLALAVFVAAVLGGLWRMARRGRNSPGRAMLAVAAGGAFVAWLGHTSVDWLHNLPGVTGVALCAAAALLAPWSRRPGRGGLSTPRVLAVVIAVVAVVAATDSIGRLVAAEHYRASGTRELRSDPIAALADANRALSLNGRSLDALYVRSAAYARLGSYSKSRAALEQAVRYEPHNPAPWVLLGDIAARHGDFRLAKRNYQQALRLDPHNSFVPIFVANPRGVLSENP
jgi:hypothetical protein